jgi:hypothetical protein
MKKALLILLLVIGLGFFIYQNFLYIDPEYNCYIKVIPTFLPSNFNTKEVIGLVKQGDIKEYEKLCRYVSTINKNPSCGGFDGGCFEPTKPRTIYIGNDQGNIALAAALVVHETCHAEQGYEKGRLGEGECYEIGNKFLDDITIY